MSHTSTRVPATSDYVDRLLHILWPSVRYTGRRTGSRPGATEYLVVPRLGAPKLIVPRRPRRIGAAALSGYKSSAEGRAQWKLRAVATAVRVGLGEVLPHRIVARESDREAGGIDRHLRSVLGRDDLHVAVYIGPARAVQKPVLQLLTGDGETFAFAKLGVTPFTRELVQREADSLRELSARPWRHLRVPPVLHHGGWEGHQLLVQEALRRSEPGRDRDLVIGRAMAELARARDVQAGALMDSSYWKTLGERIWSLPDGLPARTLSAAWTRLAAYAQDTDVGIELGSWHGDWATWNMTVSGTDVMVWDWEFFESGVPLGFDALHRAVQDPVVLGGVTPVDAYTAVLGRAAALLDPFGVPASVASVTSLLYALEIATRYVLNGERDTVMAQLDNWLPAVVDLHFRSLPRTPGSAT